jgi:uncharacterized protein YggE
MQNAMNFWLQGAKIFALLMLPLLGGAYVYHYARNAEQASYRTFTVTGSGEADAVPDVAQFSASVITEGGKDVKAVQQDNADKTNRVIGFLKAQGIGEKDIRTENYSLNPRYDYPRCVTGGNCPAPVIAGYGAVQSVVVKVRDTEKLGGLLSGAVENGANSVSQVSFVFGDEEKIRDEARTDAVKDARKKAESLARSGGFRLGRLVSVNEEPGSEPPVFGYGGKSAEGMGSAEPLAQVEPGSQKMKVRMVLTYEIR